MTFEPLSDLTSSTPQAADGILTYLQTNKTNIYVSLVTYNIYISENLIYTFLCIKIKNISQLNWYITCISQYLHLEYANSSRTI